jgi:hypothetical protein
MFDADSEVWRRPRARNMVNQIFRACFEEVQKGYRAPVAAGIAMIRQQFEHQSETST